MKHSPMFAELKASLVQRARGVVLMYLVLRVIVTALLLYYLICRQYERALICALSLILFLLPSFLGQQLRVNLPDTLEVLLLLFIFAAEILGELGDYYMRHPHWDTMLHVTSGFLTAAVGFSMIDILNRNSRIKFHLSPLFCAVAAFCFSMTIGVLWEFFEFGMDRFFLTNMQKDTLLTQLAPRNGQLLDIGLYDTMEDLLINFVGALVFSVIGFSHIRRQGHSKLARLFIPTLQEDEEISQ